MAVGVIIRTSRHQKKKDNVRLKQGLEEKKLMEKKAEGCVNSTWKIDVGMVVGVMIRMSRHWKKKEAIVTNKILAAERTTEETEIEEERISDFLIKTKTEKAEETKRRMTRMILRKILKA